jgi:hypothetical protein
MHGPMNIKFPGTYCLHFQGKLIWFRGMLKWSGRETSLLTRQGCKDLGQSELWNRDSSTNLVPRKLALESVLRQVAIFMSTNIKNSHWLDTTSIPASSFHSSDWPKSKQSSYIINTISSSQSFQHPPEPNLVTLKMEAAHTSEMSKHAYYLTNY